MSWERQVNGPGWWDIAHLIAETERTHKCVVYVLVMHVGGRGNASMCFICTAQREGQLSAELYDPVSTEAKFPSSSHKTAEGAIWEALFQLEVACTRAWWRQEALWG